MREKPFKPMAKDYYELHLFFRDCILWVEKPTAIIDDTDYTYTFYYSLVSIKPVSRAEQPVGPVGPWPYHFSWL